MFFDLPKEIRDIIWYKANKKYYEEIYSSVLDEMNQKYFLISPYDELTWDDYFNTIFTNNRISVGGMPFAILCLKKAKKSGTC